MQYWQKPWKSKEKRKKRIKIHIAEISDLYNKANKNNIDIINYSFSKTKKAVCLYKENCFKVIVIDKNNIKSQAEEKTILCEELSHYETNNLYFLDSTANSPLGKQNRIYCEGKTRIYAIKKYLPCEEIKKAITKGHKTTYELANYFNVTEEFITKAINYYKENCNLKLSCWWKKFNSQQKGNFKMEEYSNNRCIDCGRLLTIREDEKYLHYKEIKKAIKKVTEPHMNLLIILT